MMYLYSRSCCTAQYNNWCIVSCFLVPYFPYCKSDAFMFVIYIEPHTTGSCPESTDQPQAGLLPAVIALTVVLAIVALLLVVAILTIILLYTSESDVEVRCKYVHVHVSMHMCAGVYACVLCMCAFKGMS